ncbi:MULTISPECIES: type VI secretion system protein TssA [unclassified Gilliamella]|uniref:type VI secretion system protein TssA n=1 Tax=unclassified Gilliamella TaxID=2685620 RepID=UPI00080DE2F0|nr:type VI secretion system protein TssA [Gilliamella apicola]OCG21364.1 type VI secretion system ImpA domain-containing protein [Gilliamella apicola]OCG23600.1 type VI secretion system ImpA domain-containing protein [Gilliamella apicola]
MFSQLLSRFLGQQRPNELVTAELNQRWLDWLQPVTADKPAGDDLTYHDTFQEIKEEITKLSGIDYSLIVTESETILKQHSKDIRVATYYCLARLHIDGAEGFADGVELLAGLLDKFGSSIFPSRHNIRKNAVEWLANTRFVEPLTQLQPLPEPCLTRIIIALNQIDSCCQKLFVSNDPNQPISAPDLSALVHFFNNSIKNNDKNLSVKTTNVDETTSIASPASSQLQSHTNITEMKFRSQRDLFDQARKMAAFLREKPEGYLAAGRFLRVLRWDMIIDLPPADHRGRTRLPAPRNELKQHISRLILQQQWSELFERVETAFMESANHFWLDLQRATVMSLQKMGEPYQSWADIYLTDIGLMLERLNGVERLCFENGMPFADDETLSWIANNARIHHLDEGDSMGPITVHGENDWNEIEKQALELVHNENLETAFQWLQNLPLLRSPKQRYLLQYTQARVAEQSGKQDIALNLLIGLNKQQQSLTLIQWEQELLFDVKRCLLRLIKQKNKSKEMIKPHMLELAELLQQELIQLDPARALSVM